MEMNLFLQNSALLLTQHYIKPTHWSNHPEYPNPKCSDLQNHHHPERQGPTAATTLHYKIIIKTNKKFDSLLTSSTDEFSILYQYRYFH